LSIGSFLVLVGEGQFTGGLVIALGLAFSVVTVRVYSKSQIRTRFDREKFRLLDGLLLLISVALIVTASGGLLQ